MAEGQVFCGKRDPERDAFQGSPPFAGKYTVERVLGQGGMGTVFEARHARLGHRVAIKVLGSELRDHPELVVRFEREARAAGSLTSPHAVRIFDIDLTHDGTPFIVMELLHGEDLAHVIDREGPQPVGRAVRWVLEACDAIAEAHARGIIHRDLKPSNLFLSDDGGIKVLDFGIAKRLAAKEAAITNSVAPLGTPQYMSPEQVRCAKNVDVRTDIWSLGVTLFELLTGRPPFDHEIPQACIAAIAADPVPDPRTFREDLPEELARVVLRALAKDPEQRFESVRAFAAALSPFDDLHASLETRGVERTFDAVIPLVSRARRSSIPPAVSRARGRARSRLSSRAAAGVAAALGLVALALSPRFVHRTPAETRAAVTAAPKILETTPAPAPPAAPPVEHVAPPPPPPVSSAPKVAATTTAKPAAKPRPVAKPAKTDAGRAPRPVASVASPAVHGGLSGPGF